MKRTQHSGAFLIVEGPTDSRILRAFIADRACQIVLAHNKKNALETLAILEQEGVPGVLAVVDADFWTLEGIIPPSPNTLLTDVHDMENLVLQSPALDRVVAEYGSEKKLAALMQNRQKDVRQILLNSGLPIGYLRWLALKKELPFSFEGLPFQDFTDLSTCEVDVQKFIRTLKNHSRMPGLDHTQVLNELAGLQDKSHDPWHVCCGHDLTHILSIGLRKAMGTNNAGEVKPEIIEKSLRLAYEAAYFHETRLYRAIQIWEQANHGYQVLAK